MISEPSRSEGKQDSAYLPHPSLSLVFVLYLIPCCLKLVRARARAQARVLVSLSSLVSLVLSLPLSLSLVLLVVVSLLVFLCAFEIGRLLSLVVRPQAFSSGRTDPDKLSFTGNVCKGASDIRVCSSGRHGLDDGARQNALWRRTSR